MIRKRKPQEQDGTYLFSWTFFVSTDVRQRLKMDEILAIYQDVKEFVKEKNGIDCLQVYENYDWEQLYFIDQLSKEIIQSKDYSAKFNYCTLMFDYEY